MLNLSAIVEINIPILKDLPDNSFPFDVGALTIKSKDGERSFIVDSVLSHRTIVENPMVKGENFHIEVKCLIDLDCFSEEDNKYDLTESDIKDSAGEFFCVVIEEFGDENTEYFDMDNAKLSATVILTTEEPFSEKEFEIPVTLED